jgi:transposase
MTDSGLQRMRLDTLCSLLQEFPHFVIPQVPNIVHKYSRPCISSGQRNVHTVAGPCQAVR